MAVPGVVDQDDLDARWINALPGLGVLLALWSDRGSRPPGRRCVGRSRRVATGFGSCSPRLLVLIGLPWFAAEAGLLLPGRRLHGRGDSGRPGRGSRRRAPRLPPRHGRRHARADRAPPLTSAGRPRARRHTCQCSSSTGSPTRRRTAWNEQLWKRDWVGWHTQGVIRPELHASAGSASSSPRWRSTRSGFAPSRQG